MTVNVHNTAPNTTFEIWRAREPVGAPDDGVCSNTNYARWTDASFTTSPGGAGAYHFYYTAPFPDDETFDVRFQFRSADNMTVLQSDCLTITVK